MNWNGVLSSGRAHWPAPNHGSKKFPTTYHLCLGQWGLPGCQSTKFKAGCWQHCMCYHCEFEAGSATPINWSSGKGLFPFTPKYPCEKCEFTVFATVSIHPLACVPQQVFSLSYFLDISLSWDATSGFQQDLDFFFLVLTAGLEAEEVKCLLWFKRLGRGLGGTRAQDTYSLALAFAIHFSATWSLWVQELFHAIRVCNSGAARTRRWFV